MKHFILILTIFIFAACKKANNNVDVLPPITQTGAGTFGCLINGKVYLPKGFQQNRPSFQVEVDANFNDGSFGVTFFNISNDKRVDFTIGSDSIRSTGYYEITNTTRAGVFFAVKSPPTIPICSFLSHSSPSSIGFLKVTRYDLTNRIFSGEFEFHFVNPDCGLGDTIHITQGRFDKKIN